MAQPTEPTTWRDSVVQKLRDRSRAITLDQIAEDLNVSVGWLKSLTGSRGRDVNPGINTMEALDRYLTERE